MNVIANVVLLYCNYSNLRVLDELRHLLRPAACLQRLIKEGEHDTQQNAAFPAEARPQVWDHRTSSSPTRCARVFDFSHRKEYAAMLCGEDGLTRITGCLHKDIGVVAVLNMSSQSYLFNRFTILLGSYSSFNLRTLTSLSSSSGFLS